VGADRRAHPLLLVDLAVPRDVEPAVAAIPGVTVVDMDTVGSIRQNGLQARRRARGEVAPVLEAEAEQLWQCLNAVLSERCLADWRAAAHEALENEQARLFAECPDLPPAHREKLEAMSHRLLHRLLTWPMKAMACAMREGLPCADVFPELEADAEDAPLCDACRDAAGRSAG